ncbi:MAG: tRNA 4-thiouridine(8) synthase ThiI [Deltaproteobacteria bacterium]|nr:MAG: tRNA 4-thiouridine(8) synthase ThiI [Deltaproteobacteria bacterium]
MKALCLFSGGLDSILAVKLVQEQGTDVIGISFESPFFSSQKAIRSAQCIGLPLKIVDITDSIFRIVLSPRHGYGKGLNPCIDCHALMFKIAGGMLQKEGADFLISGEVLGQRPMSQNLRSLSIVSHDSGFGDFILRPLSAKRLPESLPEREGWVMKERLLGLSGRSRKPQMELAKKFGIKQYPAPAGGCLLTEKVFSRRLRDLISGTRKFSRRDVELLKWGRHFRICERGKIVVGRNQKENEMITSLRREGDMLLTVESFPGPTVLAIGELSPEETQLAASITVSYSDAASDGPVAVQVTRDSKHLILFARGKEKSSFHHFMI